MAENSSGRKSASRVLLVLGSICLALKVVFLLQAFSTGNSLVIARELDFTNPSLIGLLWPVCLIAYFFVKPGGKKARSEQNRTDA